MATFAIPNTPNVNGLQPFLSAVNMYGAGLAASSQFLVVIHSIPAMFDSENIEMLATQSQLSFLCEQAELPGRSLTVNDARYYGPNFKYPVQSEYTDISMTFLVRDKMLEKQFFDNWIMSINPTNTYDFLYKKGYATSIDIIQYSQVKSLDRDGNYPSYMLTLRKAFPISVAPMPLSWSEEGFHRLQVTFAYTEFSRRDDLNRFGYSFVLASGGGPAIEITSGSVLDGTNVAPTPIIHSGTPGKKY